MAIALLYVAACSLVANVPPSRDRKLQDFENPRDAEDAVYELNGREMDGQRLLVRRRSRARIGVAIGELTALLTARRVAVRVGGRSGRVHTWSSWPSWTNNRGEMLWLRRDRCVLRAQFVWRLIVRCRSLGSQLSAR
jgi:hypothetical protein